MDLFNVPHKKKEILEDGTVIIHLNSKAKYDITIKDNFIKVKLKGFMNFMNKGLVGEKTYNLDTVTGVQIKEPGFTTGYMAIQTMGTFDVKGGVQKAVRDENSILFLKNEGDLIHQIQEYIEDYLTRKNQPQQQVVNQTSNLDELKKLKELLDMGAITQEEFDQQKQRLLGTSIPTAQDDTAFDFSNINF